MTTLAQYDAARAALAAATRVDEVLTLREQMDHIRLHAKHVQDRELMADATEIQIRAETKLGFLLGEAKKAGLLKASRPKKPDPKKPSEQEGFTLKEIGVTEKLSAGSQKKASISEQALESMIEGIRNRIISGKARIIESEPINGARAIMGSRQEPDDSLDYFPTGPWMTRALVEIIFGSPQILPPFNFRSIWEPACGEGHMAEVLSEYCSDVTATDIFPYGYGNVFDFRADEPKDDRRDWIITNPPFAPAEEFALKALRLARVGVALFVRWQWIETVGRYERLFNPFPPTLVCPFAERAPLHKGRWEPEGSTATAYCWIVWLKNEGPNITQTRLFWIPPGCRESLTHPDDAARFTAHPVIRREDFNPATGAIIEPAMSPAP